MSIYILKSKKFILRSIVIVFLLLASGLMLFAKSYTNEAYRFIEKLYAEKYGYLSYSVYVLKDSPYRELTNLKDSKIAYLKDEHSPSVEENLNFPHENVSKEDLGSITSALLEGEVEAIILESASYDIASSTVDSFEDLTRVIHTFEIKIENKTSNEEEIKNVTQEPFILYISGIDKYGNVSSIRGRSDVNQLAVINPKKNKILLVNTPRDYYVNLHGKTGLKDKLTHAGIYGIDMSMKTIEDLYETNINYYLRVNFNTLIKVVDEIGGIDIYSDKAFRAWTDKSVYVEKGMNHFNGKQALAYSRERYAYASGDRHRGENQQQVITAIIEKVTSSEVLIKNYSNILESLSKTFQTNMDYDTITSFLRYQLDKMPKWDVEMISVTGSDSRNYTYSMGTKYLLYVMEPNEKSVQTAKERIEEVLHEN